MVSISNFYVSVGEKPILKGLTSDVRAVTKSDRGIIEKSGLISLSRRV